MYPFVPLACVLGFCGVALGAFGAHALEGSVSPQRLEVWATAVHYQFVHALAIVALTALFQHRSSAWLGRAQFFFSAGVVVFSGSLYLLVLTDTAWWGAVTPIGGVCFLVGWFCAFMAVRTTRFD